MTVATRPPARRSQPHGAREALPSSEAVHQYARDVVVGKYVVNRYVRLACQRHLDDLEHGAERGLRFNDEEASLTLDFYPRFLRLEAEAPEGIRFDLLPWQAFVVGSLEGWQVLDEDGVWVRRFRNAFVETGKGSGKTPMLAGFGLRGITRPGVAAPEVYSAASTRDQSKILWTDADRMVARSPALKRIVQRFAFSLAVPSRKATFQYVSSEAKTVHGHRPYLGLIDEEHAHDTPDVIDAIRAGTKGQRNALIWRITNSGFDRQSICWADHEYSVRILEGQLVDDAWFAYVCGLDMCDEHRPMGRPEDDCSNGCDDWRDESVWPKSNPSIGRTIPMRYLREQVTEALGKPALASTVKRLNFCIWTEGSGRWLDAGAFAQLGPVDAAGPTPLEDSRDMLAGLDLASRGDLNALTYLSVRDDCEEPGHSGRCYDLRSEYWLPEENMTERVKRDHVPYDVWAAQGWITLTPGNTADHRTIRRRMLELREHGRVLAIGHDQWNAHQLVSDLLDDDFLMVPVPQTIGALNEPAKRLADDIAAGLLHHDGNPVLRWMVGNVMAKEDAYGSIRPDRQKSGEKIDGVSAWCDALFVLIGGFGQDTGSVYDDPDYEGLLV